MMNLFYGRFPQFSDPELSKMNSYRIKWKGRESGPYTETELRDMLANREIRNLHEVEVEGEWVTIRRFFKSRDLSEEEPLEISSSATTPPPKSPPIPVAPESKSATPTPPFQKADPPDLPKPENASPVQEALNREEESALALNSEDGNTPPLSKKSALPKPDISKTVVRQTRAGEFLVHAGFWYRILAAGFDMALVFALPILIVSKLFSIEIALTDPTDFINHLTGTGPFEIALAILLLVLNWLYFAFMESSMRRGTIGKIVLGLVVTDELGKRISFQRASLRFFSKFFSGIILLAGFFLAAFTRRRQGLHDLISRCTVNHALPSSRLLRRTPES